MILDKKLLNRILDGSTFLGSGGGGTIKAGQFFINKILKKRKGIELFTFPLKPENKKRLACIVCDIGSITAFEKNQDDALIFAWKKIQNHFKNLGKLQAVFPIETGPENTFAAFLIASEYNIPVVDGDGAARAVPTLPLSTYSVAGANNKQPVAIANGNGDSMLMFTDKLNRFDNLLRKVAEIDTFSNSASLALWPDTIEELSNKCIQGSITKALYCGQLLEGLKKNNQTLIKTSLPVVNELEGFLIAKGTVIKKSGSDKGAFNFTTTTIDNEIDKSEVTVLSQNESLLAFSNRSFMPLATAPDSICYLDFNFNPLTNAEINDTSNNGSKKNQSKQQKIFLIGIKANKKLHHPIIKKGFKEIIEGLGYWGDLDINTNPVKPLGDLLVELKNKR